ncbi:hypothetical protein ACEPAH_200 [Sanghuangporus vaninii]
MNLSRGEDINANAVNRTAMMKKVPGAAGRTLKPRPCCHLTLQFKWRQFTSAFSTNLHGIGTIGNAGMLDEYQVVSPDVLYFCHFVSPMALAEADFS